MTTSLSVAVSGTRVCPVSPTATLPLRPDRRHEPSAGWLIHTASPTRAPLIALLTLGCGRDLEHLVALSESKPHSE
jgi:hypothetical protein